MRVSELIGDIHLSAGDLVRARQLAATGVSSDTRQIQTGDLFVSLATDTALSDQHIDHALRSGASAVLVSSGYKGSFAQNEALFIATTPLDLQALADMSVRMWRKKPEHLVCVTGTNGKTSVSFFTAQLFQSLHQSAACLGTVGIGTWPKGLTEPVHIDKDAVGLTTPDVCTLHRTLGTLAQKGIQSVCLEASSHGLHQGRLAGLSFQAGAFTNFTQDHLDYHGSMEAYFEAKMSLFASVLKPNAWAVLNYDIPEFSTIRARCLLRGIQILTYGTKPGADLEASPPRPHAQGMSLYLSYKGKGETIVLPMVGDYQAHNVLAALGLVLATFPEIERQNIWPRLIRAATKLSPPPGRLEAVGSYQGAMIYVDYAHTPDAYVRVCASVRPYVTGRLWVLFGCGGDRDGMKRPLMGRAAHEGADGIILTDDNPRTEDPAVIRAQVKNGIPHGRPHFYEIPDREKAIQQALELLSEGDVLLLLGKGHEQGQILGTQTIPFHDPSMARHCIAQKNRPTSEPALSSSSKKAGK